MSYVPRDLISSIASVDRWRILGEIRCLQLRLRKEAGSSNVSAIEAVMCVAHHGLMKSDEVLVCHEQL